MNDVQVVVMFQISITGVDGSRIIQRNDICSSFEGDLRESAGAASCVEHPLSPELARVPSGCLPESVGGNRKASKAVELRLSELIPLQAEVVSVIGLRNKTRNE